MAYEVRVTGPAKDDIWRNYRWWSENRSHDQAIRWFLEIDAFIPSLSDLADRYPLASESELRAIGIRQAPFGISRRPMHRVLYGVVGDAVVVYRLRSLKQDAIGEADLD